VRTGGDARLAWGLLLPDLFTSLTCWSVYTIMYPENWTGD